VLLATETVALLVMQPAKLLKDLCMIWVPVQHTAVGIFGIVVLDAISKATTISDQATYIFLLLMDMPDLKPNILFGQRSWWHRNNVPETLQLFSDLYN
jgi:hypothetical protein